jgi:hypothetical protein
MPLLQSLPPPCFDEEQNRRNKQNREGEKMVEERR